MARTLRDIAAGEIVTLNKIKGDRVFKKKMLDIGIGVGCDITVKEIAENGAMTVESGIKTLEFSSEEAQNLIVTEQFKRNMDPVIFGGCCSYGNTAGAMDLAEKINAIFDEKRTD